MESRGKQQFSVILTSEKSILYPDNEANKFCVQLHEPLEFYDDWEVCLKNIKYPWIISSENLLIRYCDDARGKAIDITIPNWTNGKNFLGFLGTKLKNVDLSINEENRVIMRSATGFDIGMSEGVREVLGVKDSEDVSLESFNKRQISRDFLRKMLKKNPVFHMVQLKTAVYAADSAAKAYRVLERHIDWNAYEPGERNHEWADKFKGQTVQGHPKAVMILEDLIYHLRCVYDRELTNLVEGDKPVAAKFPEWLYIHTNIVEPIDVNDKIMKVLKLIKPGTPFEEFITPLYIPVEKGVISTIEVHIRDEIGELVPLVFGSVVITLHFQKVKK